MRSFVSASLTLVGLSMVTLAACGGGGGGGGDNEPTPTPVAEEVLYVRASGDDANDGRSPAQAFRNIQTAVLLAGDGDTIVVGPGNYSNVDLNRKSGLPGSPIVLDADPSGTMTGDAPGPVTVNAGGAVAAVRLTQSTHVIIDGFVLMGARGDNGAGVIVRSSSGNATIRNCEIIGNRDGVRVQDSDDLLLFNNLIRDSINRGVFIGASGSGPGSQRPRLINNTIVANRGAGVFIGSNEVASEDAFLQNNILQNNGGRNIDVNDGPPSSAEGYTADYNLVFQESDDECSATSPPSRCGYGPFAPRGPNDINADAMFSAPNNQEFFLDQRDSPAVDAGDPALDPGLADILRERTTANRGNVDEDPIDLGYHAPQPES